MEVTYKYVVNSAPETKDKHLFLKDFFEKHFDDFMNNKTMLLISPDLGNDKTLLQLDIDFKRNEINMPNIDVTKVFKLLNESFAPLKFNLEITPGGCHIVSDFTYTRLHKLVDVKKQLSFFLRRIKNLDLDASFNPVPLKRVGYDVDRHFFYAPFDSSTESARCKLYMDKNPYAEDFWRDYISKKMLPDGSSLSYIELTRRLSKFDSLFA